MKPLQQIYWIRFGLGIVAAFIVTGFGIVSGSIHNDAFPINSLMNGISIAMVIYLVSYYLIKNKFLSKVEKPRKLTFMGIGIYFITWLVLWVTLYSVLAGPPLA